MKSRTDALRSKLALTIALDTGDPALKGQIVGALESERASLQTQIATNEVQIRLLESQVTASNAEIAALRKETTNLKRQIQANDAKMTALHAAPPPNKSRFRRSSRSRNKSGLLEEDTLH